MAKYSKTKLRNMVPTAIQDGSESIRDNTVDATVVAIAHNHPSGNLKPSKQDNQITKQVQEACRVMRLHFLDHIIVTDGGYYSYLEDGKI